MEYKQGSDMIRVKIGEDCSYCIVWQNQLEKGKEGWSEKS